jgi:hypothetical protein
MIIVAHRKGSDDTPASIGDFLRSPVVIPSPGVQDKNTVPEDPPKLFLDYSAVIAAKYALTFSGLFLKNDGGTAHNVQLIPEVRSGLTLNIDNPNSPIQKGEPHPLRVLFCRQNENETLSPMGGMQSGQISSLLGALAERGEDSFSVKIECEDFDHKHFSSCSRLRYERLFDRIWVELC